MEIYIKNMVCPRCIMTVRDIFSRCGVEPEEVRLGVVTLAGHDDSATEQQGGNTGLPEGTMEKIRKELEACGFELIDDRRVRMVEQIRVAVIEYIHNPDIPGTKKMSEYLQEKCLREYSALSKLFTEVRGMTIERYCILQKVEYVKELLFYGELSVSEIADRLRYSSVAHLSAQFKSVTGMSPSQFRSLKEHPLTPIDNI